MEYVIENYDASGRRIDDLEKVKLPPEVLCPVKFTH